MNFPIKHFRRGLFQHLREREHASHVTYLKAPRLILWVELCQLIDNRLLYFRATVAIQTNLARWDCLYHAKDTLAALLYNLSFGEVDRFFAW